MITPTVKVLARAPSVSGTLKDGRYRYTLAVCMCAEYLALLQHVTYLCAPGPVCGRRQVLNVRSVGASEVGLTAGSAANLIAVDAQRLMDAAGSLHELWGLPLQVRVGWRTRCGAVRMLSGRKAGRSLGSSGTVGSGPESLRLFFFREQECFHAFEQRPFLCPPHPASADCVLLGRGHVLPAPSRGEEIA